MRPNQQNRRMRGRNNNNNNNNNHNRKGPNPLTRNYESNGPDVKIRGSAMQIAEKYATLARDATSSGDRVMAENYLQHAEHYNRIIAAAQAQMPIQNAQPQQRGDDFDDEFDDDGEVQPGQDNQPQVVQQTVPVSAGEGPQPDIEGTPAEVALNQEAAGNQGGEPRQRGNNGYHNGNGQDEGGDDFRRRRRRGRGRFDNDRNRQGSEGGEARAEGQAEVAAERPAPEAADVEG